MAVSGPLWSQVVGHEPVLRRLEADVAHGRVAQAYLFAGPAGTGKTLVALGLAQRLNCSGASPPCGVCEGCIQAARRAPMVVQVLAPEEQAGNSAYRARLHRVETVRALQADVALRPFRKGYRVYVIRSAEMLREEAANTLLKTLEEPPADTVLVLTAEQPAALLSTVLSRLRRLDFGSVAAPLVEAWLRDAHGVAETTAAVAAAVAAGRPGKALRLATDPAAWARRSEVLDRIARIGETPRAAALAVAALWLGGETEESGKMPDEGGEPPIELALDALEWWYRDALMLRAGAGEGAVVNRDRAAAVAEFAQCWEPGELRACVAALQTARRCLLRNANASLVVEVLWRKLARGGRPAGTAAVDRQVVG
ncbi:MAG: hypothetical protein HYU66_27990 [Armatimonadetes bacterium]|nr:hypothetical protein [Armatimonadota bacterium]